VWLDLNTTSFFLLIFNLPPLQVCFLLGEIKKKCSDKTRNFKEMWEDDRKKHLWDQKNKLAVEKLTEKNLPTTVLERKMAYYKQMISEFDEMPSERNAFFLSVSFSSVIDAFKNQAKEWLDKHGSVLKTMGERELLQIRREIEDYKEKLKEEPSVLEDLKVLLNTIAEIKNVTMIMEFRISDVMEKFRTLKMYHQTIESDKMEEALQLENRWKELVSEAKWKDYRLVEVKKHFAKITKDEVYTFKSQLKGLEQDYKLHGPGAPETTLDKGLELLEHYRQMTSELNKKKDELVLAEKLFNLDISTFPELVYIENENKKVKKLYDEYREIKQSITDWSAMLWSKLDSDLLKTGSERFDKRRRVLEPEFKEHPTFQKLAAKIIEFKQSIPLIQMLKGASITERHWEKLMKETKQKFELNIKTITLEQVWHCSMKIYHLNILNKA
jgi:dynein heavy chain, axonemal